MNPKFPKVKLPQVSLPRFKPASRMLYNQLLIETRLKGKTTHPMKESHEPDLDAWLALLTTSFLDGSFFFYGFFDGLFEPSIAEEEE